MSFYKTLEQLWLKIEHKNIVLCTGNIDEIIPINNSAYKNFLSYQNFDNKNIFISVKNHICEYAKIFDFKTIKIFSPNAGIINYLNSNDTYNDNNSNKLMDEIDDTKIACIDDFIDDINSEISSIESNSDESNKKIFILDFSDIFLEKGSISAIKLSSLISSFINFEKNELNNFYKRKTKLVILARNSNLINHIITNNNAEFCSTVLSKPNKLERELFFEQFKHKFNSISNSGKEKNTNEYREIISLTDGLSFREFFQFAKIDPLVLNNEEFSFKELYKILFFSKKESEWEKIDSIKMSNVSNILNSRVKGQETAIDITKKTLIRSFTGMNGILHSTSVNKKPKGCLFFVGPTGTGKTELAKAISEFVFGDENRIIRFDMSEFNHEHSDQRLIGAPPGYIGYDAGGELTNVVKQNPFSILLFDEIEKAHGKILDKFIQILEDGRLTSAQGEIIDFSETFIIFTSNIGSHDCELENDDQVIKHFTQSVREYFINKLGRPEILNRIGEKNIVPFIFLKSEMIVNEIIDSKMLSVHDFLYKEKNIDLILDDNTRKIIQTNIMNKFNKKMGGRGIITQLETFFIDELADFIFNQNDIIMQNIKDNKITKILINSNGCNISFVINVD